MASAARLLGSKPSGSTPPSEPRQCQRLTWPAAYKMVWCRRNSQLSADNTAASKWLCAPATAGKEQGAGQPRNSQGVELWKDRVSRVCSHRPESEERRRPDSDDGWSSLKGTQGNGSRGTVLPAICVASLSRHSAVKLLN